MNSPPLDSPKGSLASNFESPLAYVTKRLALEMNWTTSFIPQILFNGYGFTESNSDKNPLVNDGAVQDWSRWSLAGQNGVRQDVDGHDKLRLGVAL